MAKTAIGTMPCQCCKKEVVVKENENGTLSYNCQWCDDAPYQKTGTLAFRSWQEKIKPMVGAEPEKPAAPAAKPATAAPAEKPKAERKPAGTLLG